MPGRRASLGCAQPAARAARGADRFGHSLDKTRLCQFFGEGRCQRGRACSFAHSAAELRAPPDLYRSQLCMEFEETGACRYGAACRFAHGAEELRSGEGGAQELKRQLETMRRQEKALEAKLEALGEGSWAQEACGWTFAHEGYAESSEDYYAWGYGPCCEMWPAFVAIVPACASEQASQPSTDCDGSWQPSTDCAVTDPGDPEQHELPELPAPQVVVKNTFIELPEAPPATARRRAQSVPCRSLALDQ